MSVLPVGFGSSASTAYQIDNSLRFDGSDDYLSRTFGTPTDNNVWTYSVWLKRGSVTAGITPLLVRYVDGNNYSFVAIDGNQQLSVSIVISGVARAAAVTSMVFRDPSAHYHVVIVANRAEGTDSNRIKIYVNGSQVTAWATTPTWNNSYASLINSAVEHHIGRYNTSYLDGYLSDIYFIDGQALTPSDFGETNAEGVWVPKAYTGTYGNNGFHLDFADGTSTTTLGYDAAGSNDWTLNGMTRAAGVNECWMVDTPTDNFATLNFIDSGKTLSNANLTYAGSTNGVVKGTIAIPTTGKWCWWYTAQGTQCFTGIAKTSVSPSSTWLGGLADGWGYYGANGYKYNNGSGAAYGDSFTTNDVIRVEFDADTGALEFFNSGVSQGVAYSGLTGSAYCPAAGNNVTNDTGSFNFGQQPAPDTPTTGFLPLCTANLPSGSITTSGSFTGNTSPDGPFVWLNGNPTAMTINGNAVTFGTHADKTAGGFKVRSSSSSYNASGSNTYSITGSGELFNAPNTAQGNP